MKRFDKGIELLTDIKNATSTLGEIRSNTNLLVDGQEKLLEGQSKLVEGQNRLLEGQNQMNEGQNKVITLLEKIESKLK